MEFSKSTQETTVSHSEGMLSADFARWLLLLEQQGKEHYGPHFRLLEQDHVVLRKLMAYALRDEAAAAALGLSLGRGLLLSGPVGCGKTSLMTLLRLFMPPQERYRIRSCRQVSFEFQREGFEVVQRYSQGLQAGAVPKPGAWLFDDLGTESIQRHYGNACQVMGEVLLSRYDLFVSCGLKTHLTTNLSSAEIGQIYGSRVRSRMREMFNQVSFDASAKDKRI